MTGEVRVPPASEQHTGGSVQVEEGAAGGGSGASAGSGASGAELEKELDALRAQLEERTADLQRVTAEYSNYRRRVDRDRQLVIATAKAQVASELLTVLDDIERAAAHGDLSGAFKAVADKLVAALTTHGLEPFGTVGEDFDPEVHEAVQHHTSPDVEQPTVTAVLRRGYRFGDRVLRPAMVVVTDAEPAPAGQVADGTATSAPATAPEEGSAAEPAQETSGERPGGERPGESAGEIPLSPDAARYRPDHADASGFGPAPDDTGPAPAGPGVVQPDSDELTGSTGTSFRGTRSARED